MRSGFDPLPIAFSLFLAVGCALPDRSVSRSDNYGFRSTDRSSVRNDAQTNERLAFKSPNRNRRTLKSDSESQENSGGEKVASTIGSPNDFSKESTEFMPGHSADGSKLSDNPVQLQALEFDDSQSLPRRSGMQAASWNDPENDDLGERSSSLSRSDAITNLEPQLWADRPSQRNPSKPSATQVVAKNDSKSVTQVAQSEARQVPQIATPAGQLPPLPWQTDLEQLIANVEQEVARSKSDNGSDQYAEYLRRQVHLRLLYLMAQRQEDALTAIPDVAPLQQEYWQQLLWAMSNSLDTAQFPDSNERAAHTVPQLNAALKQMREDASLSIKNMTFCRKISSFGNYERFPRNEFTPGQSEVLLYTEIENFVSVPTVDGEYRTSLKSLIEIADSKGKVVWTRGFPATEDFCRNPRRDYFQNCQFHIPKELSTGAYSLKLTIFDELGHKRVSNSLNFVVK